MRRPSWRPFASQPAAARTATAGTDRLTLPDVGFERLRRLSHANARRFALFATTWPGGAILGLSVVGLALRCWGIMWGAPDRLNLHPDEMNHVIEHADRVLAKVSAVFQSGAPLTIETLDPGFLNYPSFLTYLIVGISGILRALGLIGEGMWQLHVVGRIVSAVFGAGTVAVVFLIARELGGGRVAPFLAALWMAIMPLHVWESHVAVTDVMMTFWVSATLLAALRLIRSGSERLYVIAGICLGLAAGSKYTAFLAVVPVVVAAAVSGRSLASVARGLTLTAGVAFLCCFAVTPYSFLRFRDFLAAMVYEYAHARGRQSGFSVPAYGPQYRRYVYQLVAAWPFSLGFALHASVAAAVLWGVLRLDRRKAVLLIFAAVFFAVTGSWTFTPLRYYMPILVVGVIFAGLWQAELLASPHHGRRVAAKLLVVVTLVYTAIFTVQTTARFSNDTRVQAGEWIGEHIQPGSRLLMVGSRSYVGTPRVEERFDVAFVDHRMITLIERDRSADLIQITSLMYARAYRHYLRPHRRVYSQLRARGRLLARFESHFLNKRAYMALDPMFEGYFVSPTIELYEPRRKAVYNDSRTVR